ncbi:hypothetical protein SK128_009390 [Halocaridina rubra]|uniref:Uncharacterized protein n=1 Tax=Halocaridina rubra TaxID=373956 RepID=A0AAN8WEF2_HALRR
MTTCLDIYTGKHKEKHRVNTPQENSYFTSIVKSLKTKIPTKAPALILIQQELNRKNNQ